MYINTYLIFLRTLKHRYYHYYFTLQETESQRDHMTFSMSFNLSGEDLAFSLRSARLQLISMLTSTVFLDVGKALSPFSDHHAVAKIMICCLYDCSLRLTYNRLRHYIPSIHNKFCVFLEEKGIRLENQVWMAGSGCPVFCREEFWRCTWAEKKRV